MPDIDDIYIHVRGMSVLYAADAHAATWLLRTFSTWGA